MEMKMDVSQQEKEILNKFVKEEDMTEEEEKELINRARQEVKALLPPGMLDMLRDSLPEGDNMKDYYEGASNVLNTAITLVTSLPTLRIPNTNNSMDGVYVEYEDIQELILQLTGLYIVVEERLGLN